jgi:hypothetical protein
MLGRRGNRNEESRSVQVAILLDAILVDNFPDEPNTLQNDIRDAHRRIIPPGDTELPVFYRDLFGLILNRKCTYCQGIITFRNKELACLASSQDFDRGLDS